MSRSITFRTLTLLSDGGFSSEEAAQWLYTEHDELETPMQALLGGRHHRVNRIASALAFYGAATTVASL